MKKEEIIANLIGVLKDGNNFREVSVNGIIDRDKRRNKRFTFIVANYLTFRMVNGEPDLYYANNDGSGTSYWRATSLTKSELEQILERAKKMFEKKAYILIKVVNSSFGPAVDAIAVSENKESLCKLLKEKVAEHLEGFVGKREELDDELDLSYWKMLDEATDYWCDDDDECPISFSVKEVPFVK